MNVFKHLDKYNPMNRPIEKAADLLREHPWWTAIVAVYWFIFGVIVGTSI